MIAGLTVLDAGPGVTVQDHGRAGYLSSGLSRSGAADLLALSEGAALLRQDPAMAGLEMAGTGGTFQVHGELRIALTGAPMRATVDGAAIAWNASHTLADGQVLSIGAASRGVFAVSRLLCSVSTVSAVFTSHTASTGRHWHVLRSW